jgi:hypothetical protein
MPFSDAIAVLSDTISCCGDGCKEENRNEQQDNSVEESHDHGWVMQCVEPHWKETRTDRGKWKNRYTSRVESSQNDAQKFNSGQVVLPLTESSK